MTSVAASKFVILAVLDGWGIAPAGPGNAISQAKTVNMDRFWVSYPHTQLKASGPAVGLPRGENGNTETGHLNLGAGRIVYQDLERINMAIADGSFFENAEFAKAIEHARQNNSKLHLMGLAGAGGVHSNIEHLFALIRLVKLKKFRRLYLHLFTDGRDSPQKAAKTYIDKIRGVIKKEEVGEIASIMGRYWAMDRNLRWDRTAKAYLALTRGRGNLVKTPEEAIEASYTEGKTDEFIEPSLIKSKKNKPLANIEDNDAVIFFNFRKDRPRQLTKAFVLKDFDPYTEKYEETHTPEKPAKSRRLFDRGVALTNLYFVTMTEYSREIIKAGAKAAFPPKRLDMPLGSVISMEGLRQLRMTESEKERFVTFYFNGLREQPFEKEERIIIPSPKVSTYDQKPEMSSKQLTEALLSKLKGFHYQFILVNYPNADMVGHTGNIGAAVHAVETVDESIGSIANFVLAYEGTLLITADHGNIEEMINLHTGEVDTEHSSNFVPFIAISRQFMGKAQTLPSGILADVAPTVLALLNIRKPTNMIGRNLLEGLGEH